jgi:hypothetical protein
MNKIIALKDPPQLFTLSRTTNKPHPTISKCPLLENGAYKMPHKNNLENFLISSRFPHRKPLQQKGFYVVRTCWCQERWKKNLHVIELLLDIALEFSPQNWKEKGSDMKNNIALLDRNFWQKAPCQERNLIDGCFAGPASAASKCTRGWA